MKAISLYQPLATLAAIGIKTFETRGWRPTHLPKDLCIHATQASPKDWLKIAEMEPCREILSGNCIQTLPAGEILAVVDVSEILTTREWTRRFCVRKPTKVSELNYLFGDFGPNRFAWKLENRRMLSSPVKCRGRQSIWTVPPEIEEQIIDQL